MENLSINGNKLPIFNNPKNIIKLVTPLSIEGLDINKIASKYYEFSKNMIAPTPNALKRFIVSVTTDNLILLSVTPI